MSYFTEEEVDQIAKAMADISGVGVYVESYKSEDPQRVAFFDKAKLWHVIREIISVLYIDRLVSHKMFLHNGAGEEFMVVPVKVHIDVEAERRKVKIAAILEDDVDAEL